MRAESGNLAAVEHEDLIGITDGADALGDDDLRRAGKLLRKPLAERRVGLIVQRGERIVENQNFRRSCQRTRDGKPLLLPAGDVPAKLGDGMCGLFRVFVHKFRSLRQGKRGLQRRVRLFCCALPEKDIVFNRAGEQNGLLRHIAELVVERVERILAHVQPVYKDSASRRVVKARNEGGQRRLAAAGRADNGQRLALFCLEADMLQLIRSRARIAEGDIAELDRAGPGIVIGRGGAEIEKLRANVEKMIGKSVAINIVEVKQPDINAQLVAEKIAHDLEDRISFRRAMKQSIGRAMKLGAKGIKVRCGGRLGGAEIARAETYHEGTIPLQTIRADIDYGTAEAHTTYGRIGIKVWIYRGEVLKGEVAASDKRESNDRRRQNRNGKRDFNKAKKEGGNK